MTGHPLGRAAAGFLLALSVLFLAACGGQIDSEQIRVCRSIVPALNPGERVTVLRTGPAPFPQALRLDYEVERADRAPLVRWVICRFAGEGLATRKADLIGIVTEEGALSGASLYLLKRYYLETPEGVAGDPGSRVEAAVPELPRALAYSLQQLIVSLPRTAIYALLAVSFALVFGLVGRINLAFGELAAVGSAATVAGAAVVAIGFGISAPLAGLTAGLVAALFAGALHGAVGGHFTIRRVTAQNTQPSLIATVGLSLTLMEYLRIVQSPVIGLIMSELILDGKSSYDVKSIEADRYFDMPGYVDRDDIEARCVSMAGNYYGKVERPESVALSLRETTSSRGA